jgi:type II secretory pathway pseudopilin PulG
MLQTANRSNPASWASPHRAGRRPSAAGISLVEIMVVVTIISLLVSAMIPSVKRHQIASAAAVVASDLRTFATAFEGYAQEKGGFPAETAAGEMPPEMMDRLGKVGWQRVTPMGGQYNWENNQMHGGTRYRAAIAISETEKAPLVVNEEMLLAIDKLIDDGNLSTGIFRTGVNHDGLYIIQQ